MKHYETHQSLYALDKLAHKKGKAQGLVIDYIGLYKIVRTCSAVAWGPGAAVLATLPSISHV